jgi:hypothetical protein
MTTHAGRASLLIHALGVVALASLGAACGRSAFGAETAAQAQAAPPGFSMSRVGDVHDFDYFVGGWVTKQRRLKVRGAGASDWEEFPAVQCLTSYLAGQATVDELYMPTKGRAGLTVRIFDRDKHQWSIYWMTGSTGPLDPVVGGFQGNHGEFYALDEDDGRPVKVRYTWDKIDHNHARWQQAFSYDNRTWETNWVADFTRADPATICDSGRPKR